LKPNIFFRADGNTVIGLGHVIRSLALAEMMREEYECHFIIRNPLPSLKTQILEVCQSIIELPETENHDYEAQMIADAYLTGYEIVVLDGYHFQTEYQGIFKMKGCKVVCIDDIHACHFAADAIINHAGGVTPADYSAERYTQYFFGLQYALLRKPFRDAAKQTNYEKRENSIFICFGGADPDNDTLKALHKCESVGKNFKYYVALGAGYKFRNEILDYVKQSKLQIEVLFDLNAEKIVHYMGRCKMAITSPSTVAYEYLGVGGILLLKMIADNQRNLMSYLINQGFALDFESSLCSENFKVSHENYRKIQGGQEKIFLVLFKSLMMNIRRANQSDFMQYYEWVNDPITRSQSYNSNNILIEDHKKWFFDKLFSKYHFLYIISFNDENVGQVRFDINDETAIINYSLASACRGKRMAEPLLKKGIQEFRQETGGKYILVGFVKKENTPSCKVFLSLDFQEEITDKYPNSLRYTLK